MKTRFLFTGREWISDMKIYDYRARMYQPELGRFLQPDPQEFEAGDYNLYRYCHNDPVNKSDPTGLREPSVGETSRTIQWRLACWADSGNSAQEYAEYIYRSEAEAMAKVGGNWHDTNIKNHINNKQAQKGLTEPAYGDVEKGVAKPTLNWWVKDDVAETQTIVAELEHVSRQLWALIYGDLGKAIDTFNANPDAAQAEQKLKNATLKEHHLQTQQFHGKNAQGNLRHDYSKNPELWKKMTTAEIESAIQNVKPLEDPRAAYNLSY